MAINNKMTLKRSFNIAFISALFSFTAFAIDQNSDAPINTNTILSLPTLTPTPVPTATSLPTTAAQWQALQNINTRKNFYENFKTSPAQLMKQVPGQYDIRCIGDQEDPLDFGPKMTAGELKNSCLDLSSNRPIVVLEENAHQLKLGNISYKGRFWVGEIEKNSIQDVHFEIVNFGTAEVKVPAKMAKFTKKETLKVKTAHTQARFLFNTPIKLVPQVVTDSNSSEVEYLSDLTFTFNAYGVNGVGFDVVAGLSAKFGIVGKAIATESRSKEEIHDDESPVALYPLDFSNLAKRLNKSPTDLMFHYFYTYVQHAQTMGYKAVYHTSFRNCTTEAFDVMDEAFPELLIKNGGKALPLVYSYLIRNEALYLKLKSHELIVPELVINSLDLAKQQVDQVFNMTQFNFSSNLGWLSFSNKSQMWYDALSATPVIGDALVKINKIQDHYVAISKTYSIPDYIYFPFVYASIEDLADVPVQYGLFDRGLIKKDPNHGLQIQDNQSELGFEFARKYCAANQATLDTKDQALCANIKDQAVYDPAQFVIQVLPLANKELCHNINGNYDATKNKWEDQCSYDWQQMRHPQVINGIFQ